MPALLCLAGLVLLAALPLAALPPLVAAGTQNEVIFSARLNGIGHALSCWWLPAGLATNSLSAQSRDAPVVHTTCH